MNLKSLLVSTGISVLIAFSGCGSKSPQEYTPAKRTSEKSDNFYKTIYNPSIYKQDLENLFSMSESQGIVNGFLFFPPEAYEPLSDFTNQLEEFSGKTRKLSSALDSFVSGFASLAPSSRFRSLTPEESQRLQELEEKYLK